MIKTFLVSLLLTVLCFAQGNPSWVAPIGVPVPTFGITNNAPARPSPWTTQQTLYAYVDGSAGNCNDGQTSPSTGTPAVPRCTIPSPVAAGTTIEVHNTYTTDHANPSASIQFNCTSGSPCFLRGQDNTTNRPTFTKGLQVHGSYAVIEDIRFDNTIIGSTTVGLADSVGAGGACPNASRFDCADHIAFRQLEIAQTGADAAQQDLCSGLSGGLYDVISTSNLNNIVFYNNIIHNQGRFSSAAVPQGTDQQACTALAVLAGMNSVWVVDNLIYNTGQNGIQVLCGHDGSCQAQISNIWVGRNTVHDTIKNGIWVKGAHDIIFSQNIVHDEKGLDDQSGGGGSPNPSTCIGGQYGPKNVWIIYNEIYHCAYGVHFASDASSPSNSGHFIIGNVVHDNGTSWNLTASGVASNSLGTYNATDGGFAAGAMPLNGNADTHVLNNVIWASTLANGIGSSPGGMATGSEIINNIIGGRPSNTEVDMYLDNTFSVTTIRNNVFYNPGRTNAVVANDGSTAYLTVAALVAAGKCASSSCLTTDPKFVNSASNWQIQAGSSAIDTGLVNTSLINNVYATFDTNYSTAFFGGATNIIKVDKNGVARPQGAAWDMGAYEFVPSGGSGSSVTGSTITGSIITELFNLKQDRESVPHEIRTDSQAPSR